ncbi:MAG: hypothetical protein GY847_31690 [Proteobacteria bacterium]|nr:hypothetical protein [Pseudomonadota bacterium]
MNKCEFLEKCSFFDDEMAGMSSYSEVIKKTYCHGNPYSCARHVVGIQLGFDKVPKNLWPNKIEEAKRLVARS